MKSLFGAISPNRESSEHADEQIREKRERVITPASGNVFGSESFDGQPDAGDPVSPNAPTLHATSSPPALRIAASAPRSIAFMRQTLEQLLGPSCAQYLADLHATDRQSHLIHYVWTHESGPLTPAEADAVCFHAFSCLPKAVEPTAPAAPGQSVAHSLPALRTKDVLDPDKWSFTGSPEAGRCPALGGSPVTVATFVRELRLELLSVNVREEAALGQHLRKLLRGAVREELNRKIASIPDLAAKFRLGTLTFSDYEEALHRCIPVGTEAVLIRQTCSFHTGSASPTPFTVLKGFRRSGYSAPARCPVCSMTNYPSPSAATSPGVRTRMARVAHGPRGSPRYGLLTASFAR